MANCKECKDSRKQYDIDIVAAFAERTIKRLWITILVLIILLVGTICACLYHESQFEEISTNTSTNQEVIQEAENGSNTFVGGDSYGTSDNTN